MLKSPYRWMWLSIILMLPLAWLLGESFESSTLYLTWQQDPCCTMTIQWLSEPNSHPASELHYQHEAEGRWFSVTSRPLPFGPSGHLIHSIELKQLKPDSIYRFKIATDDEWYRFRTMPLDLGSEVRFIVGGDMYHDAIADMVKTSKQAACSDPHFAVIGGDIAYVYGKGREPRFHRWIEWIQAWHRHMITSAGISIPVMAAIGNHDLPGGFDQNSSAAKEFSQLFPLAQGRIYGALDFRGYLSLFLLDSGHANAIAGAQTAWLSRSLAERERIPSKFAFYHVPAYSAIRPFKNSYSTAIRKHWSPLFERGGINIAFEHHDHTYKRTYPLLKNRVSSHGVIYMGDGGWGADKARKPRRRKRPFYLAKTLPLRHFIVVHMKEGQKWVEAIDEDGNRFDSIFLNFSSK